MLSSVAALARSTPAGSFAAVMATAIVSTAVDRAHLHALAVALAAVAAAVYAVLVALTAARLVLARDAFWDEWNDPRRLVGVLTFVAGSTVLGERLDELQVAVPALVLVAVGIVAWAVLGYAVVLRSIVAPKASVGAALDGGVLLWVVATQAVATAAAMVAIHELALTPLASALAVAAWSTGVVLYLLLFAILLGRLLLVDIVPAALEPNWWIAMGATAISVLAGARILNLPHLPVTDLVRPLLGGLSLMLWAFGTWLIPVLAGLGLWRHAPGREPLRYDLGLWSMVFPLGMYSAASSELGGAAGLAFLSDVGRVGAYVALAAWAAVALGFVSSAVRARVPATAFKPERRART